MENQVNTSRAFFFFFDMSQLYELLGENEVACRATGNLYLLVRRILIEISCVVVRKVKHSQILQEHSTVRFFFFLSLSLFSFFPNIYRESSFFLLPTLSANKNHVSKTHCIQPKWKKKTANEYNVVRKNQASLISF